jgi:DNA-binding beta-propeller fold protein YncE
MILTRIIIALFAYPVFLIAQQPASFEIPVPGSPFGVAVSQDNQWLFVSLLNGATGPGIVVLRKEGGEIKVERTVPVINHAPSGIVLTHDGDMLIAAAGDAVVFFDTKRLENGLPDAAFQWVSDGTRAGSIYVNVTADDKTLFVSDEAREGIKVINLDRIRSLGRDAAANLKRFNTDGTRDAIVGVIPVGDAPIALTFSKDEKWLFTTSELAAEEWHWPATLDSEGGREGRKVPEGAVLVLDVAMARTNPALAVTARVPAGGSPVRADLSPDGRRLYVTSRNGNNLLAFETDDLIKRQDRAKAKRIRVGSSPVPVAVIADGRYVVVGNSDRFSANAGKSSTLTVLDASLIGTGQDCRLGEMTCGAFPRELRASHDGKTLYLTNFRSRTLQVIDVGRIKELVKSGR